jgi:lipoyl(octanoyl) transferase
MATVKSPRLRDVPPETTPQICTVLSLGLVEYGEAWQLQKELAQRRADDATGDLLLLAEHPHVYTLGRSGSPDDVHLSGEALRRRGIAVHEVDRGGATTYHGPGQLVAYPILDIRRWGGGPVRYVRALEAALIETLAHFGIAAGRIDGLPGVWVKAGDQGAVAGEPVAGSRKIAAIGVRISRGVTTHGFALNVDPDLSYFDGIVPCGIAALEVTSVARESGEQIDITNVQPLLVEALARRLGLTMCWANAADRERVLRGGT